MVQDGKVGKGGKSLQELLDTLGQQLFKQGHVPHQAPQRERVSRALSSGGRSKPQTSRHWKELIRPDVNFGVPELLLLLEPKVVWEHPQGHDEAVGNMVEARVGDLGFFEGFHKGGNKARGVYEGSYWALLRECNELVEMLRGMCTAPNVMEEPQLSMPQGPNLPGWDDFKPELQDAGE